MLAIDISDTFSAAMDLQEPVLCQPYVFANGLYAGYVVHDPEEDAVTKPLVKAACSCRTCAWRYCSLHNVSGKAGVPALFHSADVHADTPFWDLARTSETVCRRDATGMVFVHADTTSLFDYPETEGGYRHFTVPVTGVPETATKDRARLADVAVKRYITKSSIFDDLLVRLFRQSQGSLDIMTSCLDEAVYGDRWKPAVKWLESMLAVAPTKAAFDAMTDAQKLVFKTDALLRAGISPDAGSGSGRDTYSAVSPLLQTAKDNVLRLLETADTKAGMTAFITATLSPTTYQRRTAEATAGQVTNALKTLGDFTNTVMTIPKLLEVVPEDAIVAHKVRSTDPTSAAVGFAAQLAKAGAAGAGAGSSGSGGGSKKPTKFMSFEEKTAVSRISSVEAFVKYTRSHPDAVVEMCPMGHAILIVDTTLPKEHLIPACARHTWAFDQYFDRYLSVPKTPWIPVTHTLLLYKYTGEYKNIAFLVAPSACALRKSPPNFCFPVFLETAIRRTCGSAFEGLKNTSTMALPEGYTPNKTPVAVGFGTSVKDGITGSLIEPVKLRVDGMEMTLKTLSG
jgi:hypothetical protein